MTSTVLEPLEFIVWPAMITGLVNYYVKCLCAVLLYLSSRALDHPLRCSVQNGTSFMGNTVTASTAIEQYIKTKINKTTYKSNRNLFSRRRFMKCITLISFCAGHALLEQ